MSSKNNTGKNTTSLNQPPSWEIKNSAASSKKSFELSSNFISSQHTRRYPSDFSIQTTPDPSYTSSLDSPTQNQDSSSNKENQGLTPEEPLYRVSNSEVDQLCHGTQSYIKSIGELPIIYQIPRSQASQRRTQPYDEDKTLISNIDNPTIYTIS